MSRIPFSCSTFIQQFTRAWVRGSRSAAAGGGGGCDDGAPRGEGGGGGRDARAGAVAGGAGAWATTAGAVAAAFRSGSSPGNVEDAQAASPRQSSSVVARMVPVVARMR